MAGRKNGRDFVNLEDLRNLKSKSTDLTHYQKNYKISVPFSSQYHQITK